MARWNDEDRRNAMMAEALRLREAGDPSPEEIDTEIDRILSDELAPSALPWLYDTAEHAAFMILYNARKRQ